VPTSWTRCVWSGDPPLRNNNDAGTQHCGAYCLKPGSIRKSLNSVRGEALDRKLAEDLGPGEVWICTDPPKRQSGRSPKSKARVQSISAANREHQMVILDAVAISYQSGWRRIMHLWRWACSGYYKNQALTPKVFRKSVLRRHEWSLYRTGDRPATLRMSASNCSDGPITKSNARFSASNWRC